MSEGKVSNLDQISSRVRLSVLEAINRGRRGHIGGSFSCVEILVALYYEFLNIDPDNLNDPDRDRFIMGKGHACLSLYPILLDKGFIDEKTYLQYGGDDSPLGGQMDPDIPTIENNTGSLGHAIGICAGMALAAKLDGRKTMHVALVGDAECDEGSIWESIWFAGQNNINQLVCIIDRNRLSVTDVLDDSVIFDDFTTKLSTFGWDACEVDGHNIVELLGALNRARKSDRPTIILANTIKGKGVSFMENNLKWHHSVPSMEEIERARLELGVQR